jgi:cell division protein FtsI (penicillin-binding protein 3)
LNGGRKVTPTLLKRPPGDAEPLAQAVIDASTSTRMRGLFRLNVTDPAGTGRRAEAPGYNVGGKTGTAERAARAGYDRNAVISSFVGAFPMDAPRYLTLILLFEPKPGEEGQGRVTAAVNAAPMTSRLVTRIAPLLGVLPAPEGPAAFDAP